MKITLNIGLNTNTGGHVSSIEALTYLRFLGELESSRLAQSATEETLVAVVTTDQDFPSLVKLIQTLADILKQACIAWRDESGGGYLTGDRAAEWAPFNPEFFLEA